MIPRRAVSAVWVGFFLAGCTQAALPVSVAAQPSRAAPTVSIISTTTTLPTRVTPAPPAATPTATSTPALPTATSTPAFSICSPLEGVSLAELSQPDLLKGTFQPPRPGMDDGHHGVDLAYWSRGDRKTMLGLPVHSVFNGRVAGVILNRPPYGNAVIIETPLESLPQNWLVEIPAPAPTVQPAPNLQCPKDPTDYDAQDGRAHPGRSLYLLYAHFNLPPLVSTGQPVACGQPIGEVGTTGSSVNPHLHLETRVGPAGAVFPAMSHYNTAATDVEMRTYCTWRVSGLFQMFDPLKLLSLQP